MQGNFFFHPQRPFPSLSTRRICNQSLMLICLPGKYSFWIVKELAIVANQHMMTMVLLILWTYLRNLGIIFSGKSLLFFMRN